MGKTSKILCPCQNLSTSKIFLGECGPQTLKPHRQGTERQSNMSQSDSAPLHFHPCILLVAAAHGIPRPPADAAPNSVPSAWLVVTEAVQQGLCH